MISDFAKKTLFKLVRLLENKNDEKRFIILRELIYKINDEKIIPLNESLIKLFIPQSEKSDIYNDFYNSIYENFSDSTNVSSRNYSDDTIYHNSNEDNINFENDSNDIFSNDLNSNNDEIEIIDEIINSIININLCPGNVEFQRKYIFDELIKNTLPNYYSN